jgi:hypothetical protein
MSILRLQPLQALILAGMVLVCSAGACGERAQGAQSDARGGDETAAEPTDEATPRRPNVDPCSLLTKEEIAKQLLITGSPGQRANYSTTEFEITPVEVPWGESRRCEIAYRSRYQIGDGPAERGDFNVMVFRIDGLGFPKNKREPVSGAPPEIFSHRRVYYVTKGGLAASLTDFKGTAGLTGDENTGRVALLRRIAERLP